MYDAILYNVQSCLNMTPSVMEFYIAWKCMICVYLINNKKIISKERNYETVFMF